MAQDIGWQDLPWTTLARTPGRLRPGPFYLKLTRLRPGEGARIHLDTSVRSGGLKCVLFDLFAFAPSGALRLSPSSSPCSVHLKPPLLPRRQLLLQESFLVAQGWLASPRNRPPVHQERRGVWSLHRSWPPWRRRQELPEEALGSLRKVRVGSSFDCWVSGSHGSHRGGRPG